MLNSLRERGYKDRVLARGKNERTWVVCASLVLFTGHEVPQSTNHLSHLLTLVVGGFP